jgi:hypothetical protein
MPVGDVKADSDDKPAAPKEKAGTTTKPGVTLDAETQERLGITMETPKPAQWQPGISATGRVADPLAFMAAATDYESARTAAEGSRLELERTQTLAAQENASPRALEEARAAAARDSLALQAARAKFAADWGPQLAGQTNLMAVADRLQGGELSLVKLLPPVGVFPDPPPATATIYLFGTETNASTGEFADRLNTDPATQVQTLLFSVKTKLPPNVAVTAHLQMPGEPVSGWVVPSEAVLRYEGSGWVFVQTETNQFVRAGIPLNHLLDGGWFVAAGLAATNRIVVTGAQSVLSAELSNGGFTTGERD